MAGQEPQEEGPCGAIEPNDGCIPGAELRELDLVCSHVASYSAVWFGFSKDVNFHFAGIGYAFKQVVCTHFLKYVLIGNELFFIVL